MEQPENAASDHREQRMQAVAKLKRAASLPRMKDGRRPPMHVDGVSEGERANTDDERKPEPDSPPSEEKAEEPVDLDETVVASPVRAKRRSRSRSRSRSSKDYKSKARILQSPTPNTGDSSQDETSVPTSPFTLPTIPPLIAPIPSPFQHQHSRFLRSPTPTAQDMSLLPYPSSPGTPLPSLETLGKNLTLFRSNSAAGRMMAMHKLTGGTESYEPSLSPSPPPLPAGKFKRTNTISGGEQRHAARAKMLNTLAGRSTKDTDGEQGSGPEDVIMASPSPTPHKRRRRRSRRSSSTANANANANSGLSDSDFISTSHNTPLVPPTPLPPEFPPDFVFTRDRSVTPSHGFSPRGPTPDQRHQSPIPALPESSSEPDRPEIPRRRSVLVEEEEEERQPPSQKYPSNPPTPLSRSNPPTPLLRSNVVSPVFHGHSTDSESIGAPVYISSRAASRQDAFPNSPFTTPLKEKLEQDEEEVLYPADSYLSRTYVDNFAEREISWIADPVPQIRMPVDDDEDDLDEEDDDYEDERPPSARSSNGFSPQEGENPSPRDSSDSQQVLVEFETSPETFIPTSPSSVDALSQTRDESTSPQTFPTRLSVALPSPLNAEFTDLEISNDSERKRNMDSTSTSTWEKVKSTFTRSNSSSGRRSRSNSIATREMRDQTDSSVSRESGASLNSSKTDKADGSSMFATQQQQQVQQPALMQSPSASASYVSLAATPASRGGVSPVPPSSTTDLARYQNEKLFPFPGIKKLEEQRRAKGLLPVSPSTPEVNALHEDDNPLSSNGFTSGPMEQAPYMVRSVPRQASDTVLNKFNISLPLSSIPPGYAHPESVDNVTSPTTPNSSSGRLPMTLPGVKQWLSNKKLFSGQTSPSPISPPQLEIRHMHQEFKKPSLSDLLRRKENEGEWDELGTTNSDSTAVGRQPETKDRPFSPISPIQVHIARTEYFDADLTPRKKPPAPVAVDSEFSPSLPSPTVTTPPDALSATPDPSSSLSDYPAHSTSESDSTTSSHYSEGGKNGSLVLERLEESLARGSRGPMWASAIENTPRKFFMCVSTLQVVNPNTVKDRFLFLFSDILVIAKPLMQQDDNKLTAMERKFIVKSVVQLKNLRFTGSRSEPQVRTSAPRNALIRSFVHTFSKNTDQAISMLLSKSGSPDDPSLIGQILFKTTELDRTQLGDYLSRKSSKLVLKSYVDCFRFVGLRVDIALRVFLLSIHIPPKSSHSHPLEYLLDSFASRWYEANAGIVAYDKDLAVRLVRAIVQLNDLIHGGIAEEAGPSGFPQREINCRDFVGAFRRYDVRMLVFDDLLEDIYDSIRRERLSQARIVAGSSDIPITIKRALPSRLTYKVQSEPIVLRIPQADPHLSISLFGQDLVFDPPVLTFQKSSEASFRVMGTSLGTKSMIFCRSGPNALNYAGLPLSTSLTIERAFMRNTFQVAFCNHSGTKRRYMFSVDDSVLCHTWVSSLKRNIERSATENVPSPSKFHQAAEIMAFRTLQETLMGTDGSETTLQKALHRLSNSNRNKQSANGNKFGLGTPYHARSKSRSQVYHRHGAGKNELELNSKEDEEVSQATRPDSIVWTGRDLEVQCLQNSSISLVLSYLQVESPEHS